MVILIAGALGITLPITLPESAEVIILTIVMVVFRESGLISRKLGLEWVKPGTYLKMRGEKLTCSVRREGTGIKLTALSDLTGDEVYSWFVVRLEPGDDVQEGLDAVEKMMQGSGAAK